MLTNLIFASNAILISQSILNTSETNKPYNIIIPIIIVAVLIIAIIAIFKFTNASEWIVKGLESLDSEGIGGVDEGLLGRAIDISGYSYDPTQDIFYSNIDAWQRGMGYCRLYDEASAPFGMIIDCEPIYFDYGNKKWLIEFWKGQYDLTTGCEIGVYTTDKSELDIPGLFNGIFYESVSDEDLLEMTCVLKKNGKVLFRRKDKHWWLTGFILGEFSQPWELTMDISITLKDREMTLAFVEGLRNANYKRYEIIRSGNTVSLIYDKPRVPQPFTRTAETDKIIQKKNKFMCDKYQEITKDYDTIEDKLEALKLHDPKIYKEIFKIGKPSELFSAYEIIKRYLEKE